MKKRTTVRVITFLSAALIVTGVLAFTNMRRAKSLELYARANTQHAFNELVTSLSEISNTLEKSVYITDPALEGALFTQMFGKAVTAQMAMGILPYSSQELEQTASFLSKVGDYACTLARTVGGNGGYSEEELENLTSLAETASIMAMNLQDMQSRIMSGALTMDEVYSAGAAAGTGDGEAPMAGTVFESIEAEFPEMPTLIYDGPFSESLTSARPLYLEGKRQVDQEKAKAVAAKLLGADEDAVEALGECGGKIPCWCFSCFINGGEYYISVTKQGGEVMSMLCSRLPGQAKFTAANGISIAENFISKLGIENLQASYHIIENGILTVNFEHTEDGVICYPDLIKVGVALDTGVVMTYDAKGYVSAHHDRELPEVEITEDEARQTVPETLSIRSQSLALIPSEGGEERLCYELLCQSENKSRYIIYVNAVTGRQEKILILLEDEAGTLTI